MANRHESGWMMPMGPRSPDEDHRPATPLELFFDLVFVVAIAQASGQLHHALLEGHGAPAILSFVMVFFAIWWAWMNFTWFASSYDNDDALYRMVVFVQMTGALILAAGVTRAFDGDWSVMTWGYVVMRLAMVCQWIRASGHDPVRRTSARRFALGISVLQVGWVGLLLVPAGTVIAGFFILVVLEMLVPVWADRAAPMSWHPAHIAERYGLFTIIVLGESILATSMAIESELTDNSLTLPIAAIIVGGLLIVYTMWWLYFDRPGHEAIESSRTVYIWGYGHYLIFAAAAAVGAGLAVSIDGATHHSELGPLGRGASVAIPVAIYILSLWALHGRTREASDRATPVWLAPTLAVLVLLTPFTPQPVLLTGLLLGGHLAIKLVRRHGSSGAAA